VPETSRHDLSEGVFSHAETGFAKVVPVAPDACCHVANDEAHMRQNKHGPYHFSRYENQKKQVIIMRS
jgi:hypothetical protein